MEGSKRAAPWRLPVLVGLGLAGAFWARKALWVLCIQLLAAAALMAAALPLCRRLEKRLPPTVAALMSLLMLLAAAAALLLTLLPPTARQISHLTAELPQLFTALQNAGQELSGWFSERGLDIAPLREELTLQITSRVGKALASLADGLRRMAGGLGRVMLAPLLAFYLLRDRVRIAAWLTLLLPVSCRTRGVRAAREMRRETAAFLRGELLLSGAVGALTALGLLLTGTPAWLLLGILMGILEMAPYIGPVLAGIPAVLLSLQNGWIRALWALAVIFAVQQLEGAALSPRLLAGATQLHPMAVLLLISAGGLLAGPAGMVAALPVTVAIRGAIRGWRE